jgi:hypothetical protein
VDVAAAAPPPDVTAPPDLSAPAIVVTPDPILAAAPDVSSGDPALVAGAYADPMQALIDSGQLSVTDPSNVWLSESSAYA